MRYRQHDMRHRPEPGLAVLSDDGKRLGTVKEVSGSYFKVDAPMHRDYWLSAELIRGEDAEVVVLDVPRKEVGEHRMTEPGIEPEDDPFRSIPRMPVIKDEELEAQRARMEQELAEQSRRMNRGGSTSGR